MQEIMTSILEAVKDVIRAPYCEEPLLIVRLQCNLVRSVPYYSANAHS